MMNMNMRGVYANIETVTMMLGLDFLGIKFYACIKMKTFFLIFHSVILSIRPPIDNCIIIRYVDMLLTKYKKRVEFFDNLNN